MVLSAQPSDGALGVNKGSQSAKTVDAEEERVQKKVRMVKSAVRCRE